MGLSGGRRILIVLLVALCVLAFAGGAIVLLADYIDTEVAPLLADYIGIEVEILGWLLVFVLVLALAILVSCIGPRANGRANGWKFVLPALALLVAGLGLLEGIVGAPVQGGDFVRITGATRTDTSLEASRLWSDARQYLVVKATDDTDYVAAGMCAAAAGVPLLIAPGQATDWTPPPGRGGHLSGADPIRWRHEEGCTLKEARHWPPRNVRYDSRTKTLMDESQVPPSYVSATDPVAALVVLAARAEDGSTPDVAIGLAVASHLSRQRDEVVVQHLVDPVLLSNKGLQEELAASRTVFAGGVIIGGERPIPVRAASDVRALLSAEDWRGSLGRLGVLLSDTGGFAQAGVAFLALFWANHAGRTEDSDGTTHTLFSTLLKEASDSRPSLGRSIKDPLYTRDSNATSRTDLGPRKPNYFRKGENKLKPILKQGGSGESLEGPAHGTSLHIKEGIVDLSKNGELCASTRFVEGQPFLLPISEDYPESKRSESVETENQIKDSRTSQPRTFGYYIEWVQSQSVETPSRSNEGSAEAEGFSKFGRIAAKAYRRDLVKSDANGVSKTEYVFLDEQGEEGRPVARCRAEMIERIYPGRW